MNVFNKEKTLLLWTPQMGLVVRQDGILKYISTGVDASQELVDGEYEWRENHLTQTVASQQPRLVGGIAPNSKIAASNQNGESRFFTHPDISFAANAAWSWSVCVNWKGDSKNNNTLTQNNASPFTEIDIRLSAINKINYYSLPINLSFNLSNTAILIGKTALITLTHNGLGAYSLYINGVFIQTINSTAVAASFVNLNSIISANTASRPRVLRACMWTAIANASRMRPMRISISSATTAPTASSRWRATAMSI